MGGCATRRGARNRPGTSLDPVTGWEEVADGVFRRRYQPHDVSVCVVRGTGGLLVCDTRSSHRQADEIRADLAELGTQPVRWVVNTHAHFDHTFGNARFGPGSDLGAPIYGHERVPAHLDAYERQVLAGLIAGAGEDPGEWGEVVITPPTVLVGTGMTLDLGGTVAQLLHLGRGHTDNDLLVHLPDSGAWLAGDLVEESGPPAYGPDSFPLDWPATVGRLRAALREGDVLVPGHGAVVDAAFAAAQHEQLSAAAALITGLHAAGVPEERAIAEGGARWPFPAGHLADAVRRGYRHLSQPPARS
jgi:glyoxylase-like metal-dependent hydrolase (beta-lactamase superfamily II)